MLALDYGFLKPEVPDRGGIVFPALEANWVQVSTHNHDGVNSALIAGLSLPPQAGNAGKFLSTDGVSPSWEVPGGGGGGVITVAGYRSEVNRTTGYPVSQVAFEPAHYSFPLNNIVEDVGGLYNTGTFEWTIPSGYVGNAYCRLSWTVFQNANGTFYWIVFKNGVRFKNGNVSAVNGRPTNHCVEFIAVANDVIKIVAESGTVPSMDGDEVYNNAVFTIEPK